MILMVLKNTRDNIVEKEFTLAGTSLSSTIMMGVYGLG